jgi:hypothetical protein
MESAALWLYDLELWATRSKCGYSLWLFSQGDENEPHQVSSGNYPGNRTCRSGVRGCAWISYLKIKNDLQMKMR